MAVPGQFAVYGDSKLLGFGCFLEYMAVDFVCRLVESICYFASPSPIPVDGQDLPVMTLHLLGLR